MGTNVGIGNGINGDSGLDVEPVVETGDSLELAEVPGMRTGDGLELDNGLVDGAGRRIGASDCMSAQDGAELSEEPGVGTGDGIDNCPWRRRGEEGAELGRDQDRSELPGILRVRRNRGNDG